MTPKELKNATFKESMKVTQEYHDAKCVTDEYIYRQLAQKIVTEMPINELRKLIKFTKTDPRSSEVIEKIDNYRIPIEERYNLTMIKLHQVVLYEAEVISAK